MATNPAQARMPVPPFFAFGRVGLEKLQKIGGKIENVGAPTFLGGVYPLFLRM
jgi:hypothetical protein